MARTIVVILGVFGLLCMGSAHASDAELAAASQFQGKIAINAKDSSPAWPEPVRAPRDAPNIVLVMLDDAGYAAAGTFGGPARTPEMDKLASHGLRYNRFHVASMCVNTRAALLSGRNEHHIGFGGFTAGYPGYNGIWKKDSVSIAEVLRRNGYSTAAFGKWHNTPKVEISPIGPFDRWPTGLGFEYFYGFMGGLDSHWEPSLLYRNTTAVEGQKGPTEDYYLTTDLVDDAIKWVDTQKSIAPEKPFFVYFAPGATHTPHHVSQEWVEKYRGQFDQGWDKLRAQIFTRQKELGFIPTSAVLTPRPEELPAWNSLPADLRKYLAHQMEVYAAFMAQTDHEVGRLLNAVEQRPGGDNTLILYIAGDNGASSGGGLRGSDHIGSPTPLEDRLHHMHKLGGAEFLNEFAAPWAWALSAPFQQAKTVASHLGGTRNPLIVSWPARIKDHGGLRSQFTHVNDVAATLYEAAGVSFPTAVDGVEQIPLDGVSFADSFTKPDAPSHHRIQVFEFTGNRAIYKDGWVASARHSLGWGGTNNSNPDYTHDRWELYNIDADFSQSRDLARAQPQKLKELQELFDSEAKRNLIYPLGAGADFPPNPSVTAGKKQFTYFPDLPRMPMSAVPNFAQSHRIIADVVVPARGAEGVIVSNGGRLGGFTFYVKDNHLVYENNFAGENLYVVTSTDPIPAGKSELAYEFTRGNATEKGKMFDVSGQGAVRLFINGKLVGERTLPHGVSALLGSFNVGQTRVSPVSAAYQMPFKFTGTLERVRVELK